MVLQVEVGAWQWVVVWEQALLVVLCEFECRSVLVVWRVVGE